MTSKLFNTKLVSNGGKLKFSQVSAFLSILFFLCVITRPGMAGDLNQVVTFDIQSQSLDTALLKFSDQAKVQVMVAADSLSGVQTQGISGEVTAESGLNKLLEGTGLKYKATGNTVTIVETSVESNHTLEVARPLTVAQAQTSEKGTVSPTNNRAEKNSAARSTIEEVIVTANKREQNIQDIPFSITAIGEDELKSRGIGDLETLSFAVPGLFVADGGSFQRRISIRGIGNVFGSSSLVGLYVDESAVAAVPTSQLDLRVYDIKRIEVLKGPQGTLYGEGSVGGTIRYITNDPDFNTFGGELVLDGSFTKNGDPSQELRGVLNIPLIDNKLGLRVVGQYLNSGGWINQPALSKEDINDVDLFNIRAKLLWAPTNELEVGLSAIVHRNDAGADNVGEDDNGNFRQAFDDPSTPKSEDDYELLNLTINYDFSNLQFVSASSYLNSDKRIIGFGNQCCFPTGNGNEFWNLLYGRTGTTAEIFTQEVRLGTTGSDAWNWTFGLFYRNSDTNPITNINFVAGVPNGIPGVNLFTFPDTVQQDKSESWAVFGETSLEITDKLLLGAGLRYFEDERKFRGTLTAPFDEASFDSLNPKVFVSYAMFDNLNLYANAAKGFRSGGLNPAGRPPFKPDSVWSYEAGGKFTSNDDRLIIELAGFFSDYQDYQINSVDPAIGLNIISNSGEAEIKGIDLNVRYFAAENIEIGVSVNYQDAEFTSIDNVGIPTHVVGDPVDLVPEYGVSAWGRYDFQWFDNSPGFVRLDYNQQGRSYYRNRTLGPGYVSTSEVTNLLNVRIGWERRQWSLELYGENLLNDRDFSNPFVIELLSGRPRPLTFGLSARIKF